MATSRCRRLPRRRAAEPTALPVGHARRCARRRRRRRRVRGPRPRSHPVRHPRRERMPLHLRARGRRRGAIGPRRGARRAPHPVPRLHVQLAVPVVVRPPHVGGGGRRGGDRGRPGPALHTRRRRGARDLRRGPLGRRLPREGGERFVQPVREGLDRGCRLRGRRSCSLDWGVSHGSRSVGHTGLRRFGRGSDVVAGDGRRHLERGGGGCAGIGTGSRDTGERGPAEQGAQQRDGGAGATEVGVARSGRDRGPWRGGALTPAEDTRSIRPLGEVVGVAPTA